MVCIDFFKKIV